MNDDHTCDESCNHVTLCWKDTFGTDREYEMAFGYDATDGEPTAAIMWDGCDHPISIPISVMLEAISNGWHQQAEANGWVGGDGKPLSDAEFGERLIEAIIGDPALN